MSGARTHMLIGAVGGLALVRSLPALPALATLTAPLVPGCPRAVLDGALVRGSVILAMWPDIDEPGSWVSQRVRGLVVVLAALLGLDLGWMLPIPGWVLPRWRGRRWAWVLDVCSLGRSWDAVVSG